MMVEIVPSRSRGLWSRCHNIRRATPCPSWARRDRLPLCTTFPLLTCSLGKMPGAKLEISFRAASPRCTLCHSRDTACRYSRRLDLCEFAHRPGIRTRSVENYLNFRYTYFLSIAWKYNEVTCASLPFPVSKNARSCDFNFSNSSPLRF